MIHQHVFENINNRADAVLVVPVKLFLSCAMTLCDANKNNSGAECMINRNGVSELLYKNAKTYIYSTCEYKL